LKGWKLTEQEESRVIQGYSPDEEFTNVTRVKIRKDDVVKFQNFVNDFKNVVS